MGVTLSQAEAVVAAAKRRADALGVPISVAVVDLGGNLVAFACQDGAMLVSRDLAVGKAYTAVALQMPTSAVTAAVQPGGPFFNLEVSHAARPLVTFGGGHPLGEPLAGAVGVSGGTLGQDEDIVAAAVAGFVPA
jgi:uncharacterized protein GlcG (DUF336 family)